MFPPSQRKSIFPHEAPRMGAKTNPTTEFDWLKELLSKDVVILTDSTPFEYHGVQFYECRTGLKE